MYHPCSYHHVSVLVRLLYVQVVAMELSNSCQDATVSSTHSEILMSNLQQLETYQNDVSPSWKRIPETTWGNLQAISARLLLAVVRWARGCEPLPSLPLDEQIRLIRESWKELFIIHVSQWQISLGSEQIKLKELISKFRNLDYDEYALVKCIVLLKPHALELESSRRKVNMFRERVVCLLNEYGKYPGLLNAVHNMAEILTQVSLDQTFFYNNEFIEPLENTVVKMYVQTPTFHMKSE